jgi:hypothetical protein
VAAVAAAHQTHRWVQGRISPQVEVVVVVAAVVVEVVGILTYRAAVAAVVEVVGAGGRWGGGGGGGPPRLCVFSSSGCRAALGRLTIVRWRLTTLRCKVFLELFRKRADARRASAVHGRCDRLLCQGRTAERRAVVVAILVLVLTS